MALVIPQRSGIGSYNGGSRERGNALIVDTIARYLAPLYHNPDIFTAEPNRKINVKLDKGRILIAVVNSDTSPVCF